LNRIVAAARATLNEPEDTEAGAVRPVEVGRVPGAGSERQHAPQPSPIEVHPLATRTAPAAVPAPNDAARILAGLGFLVRSDLPDAAGPATLLVALREKPALTHYDPEVVRYWVSHAGAGRRANLTRVTPLPIDRAPFSWGEIRIADRLRVTNEYLTFGGTLTAADIDGVAIAVFESPVPLLRRGGHSQGWDDAAESVGAFFGRARVAVDYVPGFEARFAGASPEARYAAFVADLTDRYRADADLREAGRSLWGLATRETRRLERACPADLRDGRRLLDEIRSA
jgi:hypothetical protein